MDVNDDLPKYYEMTGFGRIVALGGIDTDFYAIAWNKDGYTILHYEYQSTNDMTIGGDPRRAWRYVGKSDTFHSWNAVVRSYAMSLVSADY